MDKPDTAARIGTPETWQNRINLILERGLRDVAESVVNRWFLPEFSEFLTESD
jgi:3-oxoadipate enol-lactonase